MLNCLGIFQGFLDAIKDQIYQKNVIQFFKVFPSFVDIIVNAQLRTGQCSAVHSTPVKTQTVTYVCLP